LWLILRIKLSKIVTSIAKILKEFIYSMQEGVSLNTISVDRSCRFYYLMLLLEFEYIAIVLNLY